MSNAMPVLVPTNALTHQWLALAPPTANDLALAGQAAGPRPLLVAALGGLMLLLLALNLWLLADRARRRWAERDLYRRLFVLETDRRQRLIETTQRGAAAHRRGHHLNVSGRGEDLVGEGMVPADAFAPEVHGDAARGSCLPRRLSEP